MKDESFAYKELTGAMRVEIRKAQAAGLAGSDISPPGIPGELCGHL